VPLPPIKGIIAASLSLLRPSWLNSDATSNQIHAVQMIDWGFMALSAQIGYIVPLKSMLQLKNVKLMKKLTMLRIGKTYNKPCQ